MTRINVIDPRLLSDKHLGAEYRELPRVFGLVRAAIARGVTPLQARVGAPQTYTMGRGHVLFFYTRLRWVENRYYRLVEECKSRGRTVEYPDPPSHGIPAEWFGDWKVPPAAIITNTTRIENRGGLRFKLKE